MQEVKNIIFDFGGVFIDVDYSKTEKAFVAAGITRFHDLYSQHAASPLFEQLERGEVDTVHFFNKVRAVSGLSLPDDKIIECWNSMLGDFYPEAIEKLQSLRQRYRVFLFSNTNSIHHHWFTRKYAAQFGKGNFDSLFEKTWYSHHCGIRKPYIAAYEWVLRDAGLDPKETLFIDDTKVNIEGAEKVGLQTIYLAPPMKMWELDL